MEIPNEILKGILRDEERGYHDFFELTDGKRPLDKLIEVLKRETQKNNNKSI